MRPIILFSAFLFILSNVHGQRLIERNLMLVPLADSASYDSDKGLSWAHSFAGWASFGAYSGLSDQDHAWYQHLGAMAELVRFSSKATLAFTTQIEFIADPFNNINFNPRAIFWEEGIFYMRKRKEAFWRLGYYHRCKHDIDNLFLGEERTLIYGSLMGEWIAPIQQNYFDRLLWSGKWDMYTIMQDDREILLESGNRASLPIQAEELNVLNLAHSLALRVHAFKWLSPSKVGFYANAYLQGNVYGNSTEFIERLSRPDRFRLGAGLSAGLALEGSGQIRLGFDYEYLPDTGISISPQSAHLLSFGIKGLSPSQLF